LFGIIPNNIHGEYLCLLNNALVECSYIYCNPVLFSWEDSSKDSDIFTVSQPCFQDTACPSELWGMYGKLASRVKIFFPQFPQP
jgi:hypothetical protein